MRVRCSFCGVEYEAAVTRSALLLVGRCEHCGRATLTSVEADAADEHDEPGHEEPRRITP